MKLNSVNAAAVVLIACAAMPSSANAQTAFYTDATGKAQFAAVAGTLTTEGFEGITTPTSGGIGSVSEGTTFARNGLSITDNYPGGSASLTVLDNTYVNGGNQIMKRFGSGAGSVLDDAYGNLTFTFATPVTAFGLDIATIARGFAGASSGAFTLTVNGVSNTYNYSGSTGFGFLGFTSATTFTTVAITTSKTFDSVIDNVEFAPAAASVAAAAPEPGTWLMLIVGFGLAGGILRRRSGVRTKVSHAV